MLGWGLLFALFLIVPAAGAQEVREAGESPDWGRDYEARVRGIFDEVVRTSGLSQSRAGSRPVPPPELAYHPARLVGYDCAKGARASSSNAEAKTCGDRRVVAYGFGLLEMSQGCRWLGVTKEQTLAFWLSHELAHHVLDHHGCRVAAFRARCESWLKGLLAAPEGAKWAEGVAATAVRQHPDDERAQKEFLFRSVRQRCADDNKDLFTRDSTEYEREADREGQAGLMLTLYANARASECAFVRTGGWLDAMKEKSAGPHDPVETRAVDARKLGDIIDGLRFAP